MQRRAIDDRRHDAGGSAAVIDHVDEYAARGAGGRHRAIDLGAIGRGDRKRHAIEVLGLEAAGQVLDAAGIAIQRQLADAGAGDHPHARVRLEQQLDLARGHRAAADDQRQAIAQIEEYRQIVHARSTRQRDQRGARNVASAVS